MNITNNTHIPDRSLVGDIQEVCFVMGWPDYGGGVSVRYHNKRFNRWRGEATLPPSKPYIWLQLARWMLFIKTNPDRKGRRRWVFFPRRCRQIAIVHELGHINGLSEEDCQAAEYDFVRRVSQ